jgi:tryptophan halogenase
MFNRASAGAWDSVRSFLGVHYKFNTRLDTPFWRHCREYVDLAGAEEVVEFYRENGPSPIWGKAILKPFDQFGMDGWLAMLVGQKVPHRNPYVPDDRELARWRQHVETNKASALRAVAVKEALLAVRKASA